MNGHFQDELAALLAGELSPSAAAAVHAHLAACDRCRVDLAAVAFATGELRSVARLPFADPAELPPLDLPVEEDERVGPAAVVLAATDDGLDPAYQATRRAAFAVAAREGARVVLFDRSPELYLVDPYERARGNGGGPRSSLLNQRTASRLGRPYLAEQLAEASQLGLDGAAWVARGHGPDALAAACELLDAERVVLPAALATPTLIDRVRGHTLAAFRRRVPARITLADLDGTLAEVVE
ncbi:MAG TPA: zf-HC2 domain-containing protein [Actinomycetota bacterium]|jgi:anti-sigma factor RsiW|nr:zf-HC2 domain-containing protein [Actinomycetota bacterium]